MKVLKMIVAACAALTMTFTAEAAKTAKAVVADSGATLKFVYDEANYGTKGTDWFSVADAEAVEPGYNTPWFNLHNAVTKVLFDGSFAGYRVRHCGAWFTSFGQLATVEGLKNLDVSEATSLTMMFGLCESLTSLDLSAFDTSKVTDMSSMFHGCKKLEQILVSDAFTTDAVATSSYMFYNCKALKGGAGTAYDSTKIDKTYARIDGKEGQPGYFTEKTAKVVVEDGGKTLRFVYDGTNYGTKDTDWFAVADAEAIDPSHEDVPWEGMRLTVTKVVFDPSFADYRPTQCGNWFYGFEKLETIENIANLNTSEVTSMYSMFWACSSLTSLDVTGFDTSKVTDMGGMFCDCSSLTSLDVTGFDTANVTDMDYMFCDCSSLESLDVTCFNTAKVTGMFDMFGNCSSLKSLDLSGFDTAKVTVMWSMFYGCSSLKTIFASDKFVTTAVADSGRMFYNCTSLKGGNGTAYDSTKTDETYARIDGQDGQPGYFTPPPTVAKVVVEDGGATLKFVYDATNYGTKGTDWFSVAEAEAINPLVEDVPWYGKREKVTKVVFDASFKDYQPTQCGSWFYEFENLATIVDIGNLDTSAATSFAYIFSNCSALTSLDVTGFDTSAATSFADMFSNCSALTSLDVTGFDTSKVTDMNFLFYGCKKLEQILVSDAFTTDAVATSSYMFYNCTALKGGAGTAYDSTKIDKTYARIDGQDGQPGYFTALQTVTFNANGGVCGEATRQVAKNAAVGALPTATRAGYTFDGWFTAASGGTQVTAATVVTAAVAYYAHWTATSYAITYVLNGGVNAASNPSSYTVVDTVTLAAPTRDGYLFKGWSPGNGVIAAGSTGARTFTASWELVYVIPSLFDAVATGGLNPKGATYNGFLGEEALGGTFTLVVKKPKKGQSEGKATLTKLDPVTGKKVKTTGTVDVLTGEGRGALAGLVLGAKGLTGTFEGFRAQGAVDAAKAKDVQTLAVMNAFDKKLYSLVYETPAGDLAMLTATFAKKGKVKIAGTVGGAKVSGSTLLNVGDRCAAPFVWTKKGKSVSFVLWFDKSTKRLIDVSGMGAGVAVVAAGSAEAPANGSYQVKMAAADVHASVATAIAGTPYATVAVFDGKKFNAGKSAKVALDKASGAVAIDTAKGANVSGLALKYAKGTLTGSFTVYAVTGGKLAKNKFKIAGVVVDGVGYATATNKKLRAIPVVVDR